ncbi:MAG: hypothetical protein LUD72_05550 [Bacteroidales bacterium]|nr:hypothetical protein [Bacteroidales bacterium]
MNAKKFQERFNFYRENFSQEELAKMLALKETEDQESAPTTVIEQYPVYPVYPNPWEPVFNPNYTLDRHWEITCKYNNTDSTANETH